MLAYQSKLFKNFFKQHKLDTWGIELGNWYGFVGIPMGTGLTSFSQVNSTKFEEDSVEFKARVLMPNLSADMIYSSNIEDGSLITSIELIAKNDGFLGDLVLHFCFKITGEAYYNDTLLESNNCYHYNKNKFGKLVLEPNNQFSIITDLEMSNNSMDLQLVPYAAKLLDDRVRYHTRCLCFGGENSHLFLRTRGAPSCFKLGPAPIFFKKHLYRLERKAPHFLRNTQLCAASRFPKGATVRLWQRITKNLTYS